MLRAGNSPLKNRLDKTRNTGGGNRGFICRLTQEWTELQAIQLVTRLSIKPENLLQQWPATQLKLPAKVKNDLRIQHQTTSLLDRFESRRHKTHQNEMDSLRADCLFVRARTVFLNAQESAQSRFRSTGPTLFLRFKKMKHMSTQHAIAEKNLDCIFSKLERANSLLGHMHCRKISERIELGRHKKNWKFEIQKVDAFRFTVIHWTTILFVGLRTL